MTADASEILLRSLAGLGIFFFGIKMINRNLAAMAGDRLRRGLRNASQQLGLAMVFGAVAGFVTQSGRTTAFIMASFVEAGLIGVRRGLPVVLWANFGCTLVIFSAIFPTYLVAQLLLAVAGVSVAFERPRSMLHPASAAFGLALMLFGLQMMSSETAMLTSFHWFATALAVIKLSFAFAFLTGLGLTFTLQSHIAIMLIAVTMASRGIFDFDQTLMVIYGAHAGSSLNTWITGIHFRGEPRQIVTAQILYNLAGLLLFLALFVAEQAVSGHSALLSRLTGRLAAGPGAQPALVALLFNIVTPLLLTAALPAFHRLCIRLAPPLGEEDLARPRYLRDEVGGNAMATLVLAEKEQLRLLTRLPTYCVWSRGEPVARDTPTPAVYHDAFVQVGREIERFHNALMSEPMTAEDTEWLLNQQKRLEGLLALSAICRELTELSEGIGLAAQPLRHAIVESLDALLLIAIDGMAHGAVAALDELAMMTRDRGPTMERMRRQYLAASDKLPALDRNRILQITSLFERASWSLNRFALLLRESPGLAAEPAGEPGQEAGASREQEARAVAG